MNTYQPKKQLSKFIFETKIKGLYYLAPNKFEDERGFFAEIVHLPELNQLLGFNFEIKQINHAYSVSYVTRGFHAEAWNKLIKVSHGLAFCALVDIRPESATFKQKEYFLLGNDEKALPGSIFVSQGIANAYCVLKGPVDYLYLVDKLYQERKPEDDRAISLFDPDLAIDWPISQEKMLLSPRDKNSITLKQLLE